MAWREISRTIQAEGSSPRAAAERVAHRLGSRRDDRRQAAAATCEIDGGWSVSITARPYSSYLYSAVVEGIFRPTDRGCLFEGRVRPGWGTFLFNLTLVVIPAAGALWFTMNALGGSGNTGSRLERLALAALLGMMALTVWRMVFRDLRRLTAELEAEFLAAIRP
jgi:hypothetical protein